MVVQKLWAYSTAILFAPALPEAESLEPDFGVSNFFPLSQSDFTFLKSANTSKFFPRVLKSRATTREKFGE